MKFSRKVIGLIVLAALLFSLCACGGGETAVSEDGIVVAVSIVPEETFVKAVCGELVDTVVMIPPGYSPESYEPTPQEMVSFSKAAVYFTIGVPSEEQGILPAAGKATKVVPLHEICARTCEELQIDGGRDPHIWLSPRRAAVMVQAIADEMSALDTENAETYNANAKSYIAELEAVDAELEQMLSGLGERSFIVFHPSFGYFAGDYGLEMLALEEHGKEATAERLAELTDYARDHGIKVIFHQAEVDSRQSAAFAEEIGGKAVKLDPLSGDYIDNLKAMARAIVEGVGQ